MLSTKHVEFPENLKNIEPMRKNSVFLCNQNLEI